MSDEREKWVDCGNHEHDGLIRVAQNFPAYASDDTAWMGQEVYAVHVRITAAEARVKLLEETVSVAGSYFQAYATLHAAKGTKEGDRKARDNAKLAAMCKRVLPEPRP